MKKFELITETNTTGSIITGWDIPLLKPVPSGGGGDSGNSGDSGGDPSNRGGRPQATAQPRDKETQDKQGSGHQNVKDEEWWKRAIVDSVQKTIASGKNDPFATMANQELFPSRVNWRTVLRQFFSRISSEFTKTYRKISRGTVALGGQYVLPKKIQKETFHAGIACDASGSISNEEWRNMASELFQIFSMFPEITIDALWWGTVVLDSKLNVTKANKMVVVNRNVENPNWDPANRGTMMSCVAQWYKNNPRVKIPDVMVYMTDGFIEERPVLVPTTCVIVITPRGTDAVVKVQNSTIGSKGRPKVILMDKRDIK